jgi:hypothetical protein
MQLSFAAIKEGLARRRELIGKFAFELTIVFIGVTAAFALENVRKEASDAQYRAEMIAALGPTIDDVIRHGSEFDRDVTRKLAAFDAAIAAGKQPDLPTYREQGSERPPTRVWDGIIATGAARSLDPALFFRLASFYNRQDSFGERYIRYNDFTEQRVFTAGHDTSSFYDPVSKRLKPEFAAYVDRLRDLETASQSMTSKAVELRDELAKVR